MEESDELVNIVLSDYCKTNEIEYFAEAFQGYFNYPLLMEKKCPETYKFIKSKYDHLLIDQYELEFLTDNGSMFIKLDSDGHQIFENKDVKLFTITNSNGLIVYVNHSKS